MSAAFPLSRSKRRACGSSRTAVWLLIFSGTLALAAEPALATSSEVRFDAPFLVSCRDVTTAEFAASSPHQRLVEARFDITALPADDESPQGLQYLYRFVSPTGSVQIVDYEPRTSQATQWAGNVSIEQHKETGKSLGVSLSGGHQPLAQGTAGTDRTEKSTAQIRYELKPPMEVILVAGTVQRGTGVYFKLLPSAESAWEGSREFVIVMRVSRDWRGDIMYLRAKLSKTSTDVSPRAACLGLWSGCTPPGTRSAAGCRESESRRTGTAPRGGPAAQGHRATIDADRGPPRGSTAGYVRSADSRHVAGSTGLRIDGHRAIRLRGLSARRRASPGGSLRASQTWSVRLQREASGQPPRWFRTGCVLTGGLADRWPASRRYGTTCRPRREAWCR